MKIKILALLSLGCLLFTRSDGQVVINEISNACDASILMDEDSSANDWLELYNVGATSVDLTGYHLSDKKSQPKEWTLPSLTIASHGFLRVFCSGNNRFNPAYLHTNFKISRTGEKIYFTNPAGTQLDMMDPGDLAYNNSFGRIPDGASTTGILIFPTPGATNNGQTLYSGYAMQPVASMPAGGYASAITLSLTVPVGTLVYYSTDGSEPTTASNNYISPFSVSSTMVIKAKAFPSSSGIIPSKTITQTYLINETGLGNLPVVSVSLDPANFDTVYYGTIYNWYTFPDYFPIRKAHIEYFNKQLKRGMETDVDFQLMGNTSVIVCLQKSCKLKTQSYYDSTKINQELFPKKPGIKQFAGIQLRNEFGGKSGNDGTYTYLLRNTNIDYEEDQPCVVYFNGQYWGVYELKELGNADWVNETFGVNKDSVDFLHLKLDKQQNLTTEATHGSDSAFVTLRNQMVNYPLPNTKAFQTFVESKLDLMNYSDYFALETYEANWDWFDNGHLNNIKLWRGGNVGKYNKWRYFLYDMDYFGGYSDTSTYTSFAYVMNPCGPNLHSDIFNSFIKNDSLRTFFIDRYADLINTLLQPYSVDTACNRYRDSSASAMLEHWVRWAGAWGGNYQGWYNGAAWRIRFNNQRIPIIRNQIQSTFNLIAQVSDTLDVYPVNAGKIKMNTITPGPYPWQGIYFNGAPVTITAIADSGYKFDHWSSAQLDSFAGRKNTRITYNEIAAQKITAYFSVDTTKIYTGLQAPVSAKLSIYPNPFGDATTVYLPNELSNVKCNLTVYDMTGRIVRAETINTQSYFILQRRTLADGMYYFTVEHNGFRGIGKLNVQ